MVPEGHGRIHLLQTISSASSDEKGQGQTSVFNPSKSGWDTVNDRNRQSAEQMCQRPRGMFTVRVNYRWTCTRPSKRSKASQRKFVFLRRSSPDVQGERGGGKTNISLLESSEEWAPGSTTPTVRDRAEELGEKMKKFFKRNKSHLGLQVEISECEW